jgi:hypothetical protein
MKLIQTLNAGPFTAKVYRDADWDEFRTKFFREGVHMGEACDSFTDDKSDAINTARSEVNRMAAKEAEACAV